MGRVFVSIILAKYNIFPRADNGRSREKKILAKRFAHAISEDCRDLKHAYVYWIRLRGSASYVIDLVFIPSEDMVDMNKLYIHIIGATNC